MKNDVKPDPTCEGCKSRDEIIAELAARLDELERPKSPQLAPGFAPDEEMEVG